MAGRSAQGLGARALRRQRPSTRRHLEMEVHAAEDAEGILVLPSLELCQAWSSPSLRCGTLSRRNTESQRGPYIEHGSASRAPLLIWRSARFREGSAVGPPLLGP